MTQKLIVNGMDYGVVTKYRQRRDGIFPTWDFMIAGTGIIVSVPMCMIQSFTSDGDLVITTLKLG